MALTLDKARKGLAATASTTANGDSEIKAMLAQVDMLSIAQQDTGEQGSSSGKWVYFREECPICHHKDCFRIVPETNSWECEGASNASGYRGGTYLEYVKATGRAANDSEAVAMLRELTGNPRTKPEQGHESAADGPASDLPPIVGVRDALAYGRCELSRQVRQEIKGYLFTSHLGRVQSTLDNGITLLNLDPNFKGRFYYDTRAYTIMCAGLPWSEGKRPRPIEDVDLVNLTAYSERNFGFGSKALWADAVASVAYASKRNDVAEWLDSLKWDGMKRIGTLLPDFLGAEHNKYTEDVMRKYMLAAVARAYSPGVKFDYMPVLVGPQGVGKSYFCSLLAVRAEWFEDDFNTVEPKRACELMRGKWQAEMAELLAVKDKRNVNKVKSFLTKRIDNFRVPYDRYDQDRPRGCVFIGTTNDTSFLTDPTGNRRFLPVMCCVAQPKKTLWVDGVEDYFAQAWAEAVRIWKTEHPALVLSEAAGLIAAQMQERFLEDNPALGLIQSRLDELGNWACKNNKPRETVRVCIPMIRHEWLEQPYDQAIKGGREANELHALMQTKIQRWEDYPGNNHKARCRSLGGYGEFDYRLQRCYIPAEGAYPVDNRED